MQFRITYQGALLSEANWKDKHKDRPLLAKNKQEIRKKIHPQIRNFWKLNEAFVNNEDRNGGETPIHPGPRGVIFGTIGREHTVRALSNQFSTFNYNFVPLLTKQLKVLCELDVLLLRPGKPGKLLNAGDLDNRLKTLFDALTMPQFESQLGPYKTPEDDEKPFFCLLEDDSLITKTTVEADTLLEPVNDVDEDARAIITVRTRPYTMTASNISFA